MHYLFLHVSKRTPIHQHYFMSEFALTPVDTKAVTDLTHFVVKVPTVGDAAFDALKAHIAAAQAALK